MKKKILIVGYCFLAAIIIIVVYDYFWVERQEWSNIRACDKIKPGVMKSDLIRELGNPIYTDTTNGMRWYYFKTPAIKAGPIAARIDDSTSKVLELKCSEEEASNWSLK